MNMDLKTQRETLQELGSTDGKIASIKITIRNLKKEIENLENFRNELLHGCQHIDDEGNPSLGGGYTSTWCTICGKIMTESEITDLEQLTEETNNI